MADRLLPGSLFVEPRSAAPTIPLVQPAPAIPQTAFDGMRAGLRPHAARNVQTGKNEAAAPGRGGNGIVADAMAALQRGDFDSGIDDKLRAHLTQLGVANEAGIDWTAAIRLLRSSGVITSAADGQAHRPRGRTR